MTATPDGVRVAAAHGVRVLDDSLAEASEPIRTGRADLVIPATLAADGSFQAARRWSPLAAVYGGAAVPLLLAAPEWPVGDGCPDDVLMRSHRDARVAVVDIAAGVEPESPPVELAPAGSGGLDESTLVSVIIPTRDRPDLVEMAHCTVAAAGWSRVEVIFVDNGTTDPHACALLDRSAHRVVPAPIPFNFARLVNRGASVARGEVVVLLNNDVEAVAAGWLAALLEPLACADVGVVGSTLLYPSESVQHCGIAMMDGVPVHAYAGIRESHLPDPVRHVPGERTAVTGACMAVRASLWRHLGGMAVPLATNYNDVDLCLRARRAGARVACTPVPRLVHHESESRGLRSTPAVAADWLLFRSRWAGMLNNPDPWLPRLPSRAALRGALRPGGR